MIMFYSGRSKRSISNFEEALIIRREFSYFQTVGRRALVRSWSDRFRGDNIAGTYVIRIKLRLRKEYLILIGNNYIY